MAPPASASSSSEVCKRISKTRAIHRLIESKALLPRSSSAARVGHGPGSRVNIHSSISMALPCRKSWVLWVLWATDRQIELGSKAKGPTHLFTFGSRISFEARESWGSLQEDLEGSKTESRGSWCHSPLTKPQRHHSPWGRVAHLGLGIRGDPARPETQRPSLGVSPHSLALPPAHCPFPGLPGPLTTGPGIPRRPSGPGFPGAPCGPMGPVFPGGPSKPASPCRGWTTFGGSRHLAQTGPLPTCPRCPSCPGIRPPSHAASANPPPTNLILPTMPT